jgi:hypothetical protein
VRVDVDSAKLIARLLALRYIRQKELERVYVEAFQPDEGSGGAGGSDLKAG